MTNLTNSLLLTIGVITYSAIYLLICGYLALHLVISMLDDCHVLRRNPVRIYTYIHNIMSNTNLLILLLFFSLFQLVVRFIGPQIGNNFSQHQQTNFSPPR